LALDEPKENDATSEHDGLKFLIESSLLTTCGNVKVDFVDAGMRSGFSISSTNPLGGGGSCGSSCGSNCG
jgi:Fe-S cluster assembly iron-binding protein IscA